MIMDWQTIEQEIQQVTGNPCVITAAQQLGGGDINTVYRLQTEEVAYFVKMNRPDLLDMFEAEQQGLNEMAGQCSVRVPKPVVCGRNNEYSFLVLEHLSIKSMDVPAQRLLGRQLAELHRQQQPYYGWGRDNTIGLTTQLNGQYDSWVDFWRELRLGFQLQLAANNGYMSRLQTKGEQLCAELEVFFTDYQPQPALLHGDLWAGNAAADEQGQPVIYDPACYYGDREADIAMTELFGGFGRDFHAAYNEAYALDSGYSVRKTFYNLYHILNHLNLFGSGYLGQAERMMDSLLAEIR